jgi:hypothetical protein
MSKDKTQQWFFYVLVLAAQRKILRNQNRLHRVRFPARAKYVIVDVWKKTSDFRVYKKKW